MHSTISGPKTGVRNGAPLGTLQSMFAGVGLRSKHYPYLLTRPPIQVEWFEAISENFMDTEGRPIWILEQIRARYPVALHGVSLSIGYQDSEKRGVNPDYLRRLKKLVDRIDPVIVSDHLCWTGAHSANLHDLLPVPLTEESITWITTQISRVQEVLGRPIALENVSSYLTYRDSSLTEWDFLAELARRSGCKLLLDLNNIYVSAVNHGFSPLEYLNAIPPDAVAQFHLAGHTDRGKFLFDTHSHPVCDDVWSLFRHATQRMPNVPWIVEWDENIPDFARLEEETLKAKSIWKETQCSLLTSTL